MACLFIWKVESAIKFFSESRQHFALSAWQWAQNFSTLFHFHQNKIKWIKIIFDLNPYLVKTLCC